jgi:DNA-binding winged helix-turn-helix (wHTH) protein/tetratricopeptide (TPR) repeat protein
MTAFRFGAYRLLPQARELWRGDERIPLPPRAFDCLVYLIERRARAVGRDELIAAVWGRTEISDTMVAQTVLRIRRTLDGDQAAQEWIRTAPRFGYRWVAPILVDDVAGDATAAATEALPAPDQPTPPRDDRTDGSTRSRSRVARKRLALLALLAVVAVVVAMAAGPWRAASEQIASTPAADATPTGVDTWMILPVVGEGATVPGWMRLGVMDAIAEHLRRAGLAVLPSSQVLALAEKYFPVGQPPNFGGLRNQGGASYIVLPQSAATAQGWRISLTVQHPTQPPVLYRGDAPDLLAAARLASNALLAGQGMGAPMADDNGPRGELLARAEAGVLAGRLGEAAAALEARPSDLADDPLLLLKLAQVRSRQGDVAAALSLTEAVLAQPGIDATTRGLALIRVGSAQFRAGRPALAEAAYAEALAVLPKRRREDLADAWNGLGIAQQMQGRLDEASDSLARAAALFLHSADQLGYARALINQGLQLMESGLPHEALERFLAAEPIVIRLGAADEQSGLHQSIAWAQLFLNQPGSARAPAERAVELARRTENPLVKLQAHGLAARVAIGNGELERAQALLDAVAQREPTQRWQLPVHRAQLAQARGDWTAAVEFALAAQADETITDRESRGASARVLLESGLVKGDGELQARALAILDEVAEPDPHGYWQHRSRIARARVAAAAGDPAAAETSLRRSWTDTGLRPLAPVDRIDTGLALIDVLLALDRPDQAQPIADQLAPWLDVDYRIPLANARIARAIGDHPRQAAELSHARQLAGERPLPDIGPHR